MSAFGDLLHRLTATREELDAADERRTSLARGATPCAELAPRGRAKVTGVVAALTYRPRGESPALVARVFDGSGSIDLIFLGRRDVPGVDCGRRLVAEGMVSVEDGRRVMFNPDYHLLAKGPAA
ncbi:OB-fold nucleic acid binding domain-containing protein [Georgenia yuyongxinii]|uniref:DNA-binding protein n=1 Tax=Georgenia yuyongxinii TaxID=2589797 RepID=A0A552WWD7_9MICO|nr:OB-fold nucleic acid binding domain-containing protein [Georgenia yuyongxinii]TRW47138.1 DNA-binding protein [Georgenia yuyongxinii]